MHHSTSIVASRPAVTVLGSDRIHGPMRAFAGRSGIHLRTGGFAVEEQSSRLALTRLRRLCEREERHEVMATDIVFVEVSCSTVLICDGEAVGTNWLETNFPSLMSQRSLAKQIWRIVAQSDEAARREALDRYSSISNVITSEGKDALAKVSLRRLSTDEMTSDLNALSQLCKNLILVLPCSVIKSSGRRLHNRDVLIRDLEVMIRGLELRYFDPSPLIERFGRSLSFEPTIENPYAYSEGLVRMIAAHLGSQYLAGLSGAVGRAQPSSAHAIGRSGVT